jgi:hypothetical protein
MAQMQSEAIHDRDLFLHFLGAWPSRSLGLLLLFLWPRSGFTSGLSGV